jgi:glycosyltransferase involved in cell wall biosynthesis
LEGDTFTKTDILRREFAIPDSHIIFIYQGGLDKVRGTDLLLDCFSRCKKDRHIVFMGYGSEENTISLYAKKNENIHFKPAVPINDIIAHTSSANVGIFVISGDISLSYRYALPNKFYEYLFSGLPVVVSQNLELLTHEVKQNNLGWVLNTGKLEDVVEFIDNINMEMLIEKRHSVQPFAQKEGWQLEQEKLRDIYT